MDLKKFEIGHRYNELRKTSPEMSGEDVTEAINKQFGTNLKYSTLRAYGSNAKNEEAMGPSEPIATPPADPVPEPPAPQKKAGKVPDEDELLTVERVRAIAEEVCQAVLQIIHNDNTYMTRMESRMRAIAEEVYQTTDSSGHNDHTAITDMEARMRAIAEGVYQTAGPRSDLDHNVMTTAEPAHLVEFPPTPDVDKTPREGKGKDGKPKELKGRKETRDYRPITITLDQVLFARAEAEAKERGCKVSKIVESALWLRYGRPTLSYMGKADDESSEE